MSFEHTAKPGDRIIIVRRPADLAPRFYAGYEIGDIGIVTGTDFVCIHVEWMTNKGDHPDIIRVRSLAPNEYDVLPVDGGIVCEATANIDWDVSPQNDGVVGKSIDYMMVDDVQMLDAEALLSEPALPNFAAMAQSRGAVILDRVRVTHLDPANEDDTFGIVVGDVGEVVAAFPNTIEVRWLTNLGEYNEDNGRPLRSFVLYHNEYEIIPYSEPLPT